MKRAFKKFALLPVLAILIGCGPVYVDQDFQVNDKPLTDEMKTRTFNATFAKTWMATLDVLSRNDYPMSIVEKDSGIIATDFVIIPPWHEIMGRGPTYSIDKGRVKLNISIREMEHSTKVRINIHIDQYSRHVGNINGIYMWRPHSSKGTLEGKLFDEISKSLSQ